MDMLRASLSKPHDVADESVSNVVRETVMVSAGWMVGLQRERRVPRKSATRGRQVQLERCGEKCDEKTGEEGEMGKRKREEDEEELVDLNTPIRKEKARRET